MSDTAPLRRRLLRALEPISLAVLAATGVSCTAADPRQTVEEQRELEAAKKREAAARQAEEVAKAQREKAIAEEEAAKAAKAAEAAKLAEEMAKKLEQEQAIPQNPTPHFSCPNGDWCGTKTIAKRYASKEKSPDSPDAMGCPGSLEPRDGNLGDPILDESKPPPHFGYAYLDPDATKAKRESGEANACCYHWGSYCGGGRPLLDEGRPKFATLERLPNSSEVSRRRTRLDARIAAEWLDDARMEHASIASFLRAEAELEAVGAPLSLREACSRAADDERRHARECFAIAAAHGEAWQPGELPHAALRRPSLEQLAVDTLLEGGIGETIAALMARRAAGATTDPTIAAVLEGIATDELEHAALAWQTIAWALRTGGASVRAALLRAAAEARPHEFELPPAEPHAQRLAAHGRLDARAKAQAIGDAWCELIDPMLAELVGQRSWLSCATN